MTSSPRARWDDLRAGRALAFPAPTEVLVAHRAAEVVGVLRAAEEATGKGRWAFGFLTYEAGLALAGDLTVTAGGGPPLVWFGICDPPAEVEPVGPRGGGYDVGPWVGGLDRAAHAAGVTAIRDHIAAGDVYQVNYTARWSTQVTGDLDAWYADLAGRQRGADTMFVDTGRWAVLSASPELFLERRGDDVVMRPMKGTAPRGRDIVEDARIVATLRASEKERAENIMIVDLVRNDLARVATVGGIEVRSLGHVERYETVHQVTSEVSARLRPGVDLVDLFTAVFPSGSVTGAPKRRATEIIAEVEPDPRGIYCGAVGFLAPPTAAVRARFNVAIRTVVVDRTTGAATYGSGGGITWGSDAAAEYEEMLTKTAVLTPTRPGPHPEPRLLETMRSTPAGEVHELDRHLHRLAASAEYLGFAYDDAVVREALAAAAGERPPGRIRLTLDRAGRVEVKVGVLPAPHAGPVRLAVDTEPVDRRDPWLRHKTTDRAVYDTRRARWPAADDVVLVNAEGEVTETTIASLLVRVDGRWSTPPLDVGCLPGVARAALLDSGEVHERALTVADLVGADAIEVVNALRGRRPAVLLAAADAVRSGAFPTPSRRL